MPVTHRQTADLSMRLPLRHPWVWLGLGWLFVGLAIYVSLAPGQKLPDTHMGDKWEHSMGYALLTLWFAGVYSKSSYWKIAAGLLAMGISIEVAQGMMPYGRQMELRDVGANVLGITAGIAVALIGLGRWATTIESWTRRWW
jgi:VanZ family protein